MMTAPAGVTSAQPAREEFIRSQHAVWASLPVTLTPAGEGAQLVAVDGQSPGWLETLADVIRPGVTGVLLARPVAGPPGRDIRAVTAVAARAGTAVVVETAWASHPAVGQLARAFAGRLPGITLIESVAEVPDDHGGTWADVVLDQVSLLRAVAGLDAVRFTSQDVHGYTADGVRGAATVALAAVRSTVPAPTARLAAYGATAETHLLVPAGSTAAPAAACIVDSAGAAVQPTWYETAARASWRRLIRAVSDGAGHPVPDLPDLPDLADDADLVAEITSSWRT